MTEVSAQQVKELREQTGAGMMDCKRALAEAGGDFERATDLLRKKGLKDLSKRAERSTAEGVVYSYIHAGGQVGVLLEMNSETDFVARGEDFQSLAKSVAMHIAWANPRFLTPEDVPPEVIEREKEILASQLKPEQAKMAEKILAGKLEKFFEEHCLLRQLDVRDPNSKKRVGDLVSEVSARVGERIVVRRFARFAVGEGR